jgi:hypothetical protein
MVDREQLKQVDAEFEKRYPGKIILDGITNLEIYEKTNPKILWILKEANSPDSSEWDMRPYHNDGFKGKDGKPYKYWQRSYGLILRVSYALIHTNESFQEYKLIPENIETMKNIAFINIKKIGGSASASNENLKDFYQRNKDLLFQQIVSIAPDIIINCSQIGVCGDLKNSGQGSAIKNTICIPAYHPNCRNISHQKYFEDITTKLNKAKEKNG